MMLSGMDSDFRETFAELPVFPGSSESGGAGYWVQSGPPFLNSLLFSPFEKRERVLRRSHARRIDEGMQSTRRAFTLRSGCHS